MSYVTVLTTDCCSSTAVSGILLATWYDVRVVYSSSDATQGVNTSMGRTATVLYEVHYDTSTRRVCLLLYCELLGG